MFKTIGRVAWQLSLISCFSFFLSLQKSKMPRLQFCFFACGLIVASVLSGCGGPPAGSTVKVSVASTKVKLDDTDSLEIVFNPMDKGTPATGSGSVKDLPLPVSRVGEGAAGVLPGKYSVTVRITPYAGMAPPDRVAAITAFNANLDSTAANRMVEVTADKEQSFTIDLDSDTVTKK